MTTITIEVPEGQSLITIFHPVDFEFGNKVDGEFIRMYPAQMANSYKLEQFRYGQRKINDTCKADTGPERNAIAHVMVKGINAGDEWAGRSRGGSVTMSGIERLTLSIAKAELTRRFKIITKCGRIADMIAANDKVAAYFGVGENKTAWVDSMVMDWNNSDHGQAFDAKGQAQAEIDAVKALASQDDIADMI